MPVIVLTGASGGIGQQLIGHLSGMDEILGIYHSTSTHLLNITRVHCTSAQVLSLTINRDTADDKG